MDYTYIKEKFAMQVDTRSISRRIASIREKIENYKTREVYERCIASLDLTSLDAGDSPESVTRFVNRAAALHRAHPGVPDVASVCVYPAFVEVAGLALGDSEISITSVGGGFPASQTFPEVKMLECAMAEENGADEIDIVMNIGQYRDGNYDLVAGEIEMIRAELDDETVLKVIIESGMLSSAEDIRRASFLAISAGADFIKTSTGKNGPGATPEAFMVMCDAAKDYFEHGGETVGVKAAGGIRSVDDAVLYYAIVKETLGDAWLDPSLFRIGASALLDELIAVVDSDR